MNTETKLEEVHQDFLKFEKRYIKDSFKEFAVGMYIQTLRELPSDYILLLLIAKVQGGRK